MRHRHRQPASCERANRHAETLTTPLIRCVVETCGDRFVYVRDYALLPIGFSGAFRRSELVGLNLTDMTITTVGLQITLSLRIDAEAVPEIN
jgi:site-specific recombinase XerC